MKRKHRFIRAIAVAVVSVTLISLFFLFGIWIFAKFSINYVADEKLFEISQKWEPTVLYALPVENDEREGNASAPKAVETIGDVRKEIYRIDEISQVLKDGFIAVEDKVFYEHHGVDIKRTLKAALNYLTGGDKRFGASTITQQVIKNISGDNDVSIKRKLSEILRAMHIEQHHTKDEILELYLNIIPMSENIYGVGMAARLYFGKDPSELNAAECATLIGITNAPTAYNPYRNPDSCIKKRNTVLRVMFNDGIISESEYVSAVDSDLILIDEGKKSVRYNSWFAETVITDLVRDLESKYGVTESTAKMMLNGGGYSVYTTMDSRIQALLEEYFVNEQNFSPEIKNGLEYSMVIIDSETGDISAIVGRVGKKQGNRLLNHALVPHIPASTLKPLSIYAPLIDRGDISWATVLDDVPVSFTENNGEYIPYPHNSPDIYSGLITVKDALRLSKNTAAVRLCKSLGAKKAFEGLKNRFGFSTLVDGSDGSGHTDIGTAAMALGQLSYGIPLTELTSAFSTFPREGIAANPRSYTRVVDINGNTILEKDKERKRVFKATTARIMNKLLENVTESGTAKSITLKENVAVAGKTGTSSGNRDKLFVGYTPYYTSGIWCGYDSGGMEIRGVNPSHLKIWDDVMQRIHSLLESTDRDFSTEGLDKHAYCRDSGLVYCDSCRLDPRGNRREEGYFEAGYAPTRICDVHVICDYDSVLKGIAIPGCPDDRLVKVALLSIKSRSFPIEVNVEDAEFVMKEIPDTAERPTDVTLPYFWYTIEDGEYVGISGKRRQFNCSAQ